ncbi:MAG TPA: glycosyltransferase [Thiotrichaceae bacterium]|nr:glycosyltransferase [Thiotrichaceae bacterium]
MNPIQKIIALIVPVFNEGEGLAVFYQEVKKVLSTLPEYQWQIIFVDDGSEDNSWQVISELSEQHQDVKGLLLSRNFGKEIALTAGVQAVGEEVDAVIFIDADLQHPPELIPQLLAEWQKGFEIVSCIRKDVADYSLFKRMGSKLFYTLMAWFSDIEIIPNNTDYRLLDKTVVSVLCLFTERTRMFRGLIDWMGFHKSYLTFSAPARNTGTQQYSFIKLFRLAINSLTSFSLLPLRITGYIGVFIVLSSGFLLTYMLFTQLLGWMFYTHLAFFVVFNTFLLGILLSGLGLVALYIGHIHTEVVQRPLYIIRKTIGNDKDCI